ncbi:MAG: hypothetical protein NXI18_00020 [Alphaproteobacteria bacterium]|nr:hypothetical protein [Alphaproteobacteria bacterium]
MAADDVAAAGLFGRSERREELPGERSETRAEEAIEATADRALLAALAAALPAAAALFTLGVPTGPVAGE